MDSKLLERIGFVCTYDDGYESDYRLNNLLICGNDIDGYIFDHNNKVVNDLSDIQQEYFVLHNSKLITQVEFENENHMKWFLLENNDIILSDGYGRSWMCKNGHFYFRDLGKIKFEDGFSCGHLFASAKIPSIFLTKNNHK